MGDPPLSDGALQPSNVGAPFLKVAVSSLGDPGAPPETEIEMVAVSVPYELVAVIVILTALDSAVGVPLMTPVLEFKVRPVGKVPLVTAQLVTAPPELVGDMVAETLRLRA